MKLKQYLLMNSLGAFVASVFAGVIFRADLEAYFFPVIRNVKLELVERRSDEFVVSMEFFKAREGRGIVNSWSITDATGQSPMAYFVSPDDCAGEPLRSGATQPGTVLHRKLCIDIPRSLRDRPLVVDGLILYQTGIGTTVPARFPRIFVPRA